MKAGDIDLKLLAAFDAILKERNVTRAAQRLGLSQPATSDALRKLRHLFDDALFVKTGTDMLPTPRAVALSPEIEAILRRVEVLVGAEVPFDPATARRSFVVASTDYTSLVLLPALVARVQREAPGVDLLVRGYEKGDVGAMIDRGEIDLAIGVFPSPPKTVVRTPLFEERFVGVARADHPALVGKMTVERFAALPHALVSVNGDRRGAVDTQLGALGLRRRVVLCLAQMMALPGVLETSDLVAALPARMAHAVAGDRLRIFALPFEIDPWQVVKLWNPAARRDQPTAWLRRIVAETALAV